MILLWPLQLRFSKFKPNASVSILLNIPKLWRTLVYSMSKKFHVDPYRFLRGHNPTACRQRASRHVVKPDRLPLSELKRSFILVVHCQWIVSLTLYLVTDSRRKLIARSRVFKISTCISIYCRHSILFAQQNVISRVRSSFFNTMPVSPYHVNFPSSSQYCKVS